MIVTIVFPCESVYYICDLNVPCFSHLRFEFDSNLVVHDQICI